MNFSDICRGKAVGNAYAEQCGAWHRRKSERISFKKSFSGSSTKKAVKGMAAEEPQRLVPSPPAQILHGLAVSNRMPNSVQCLCPADAGIKRV